MEFPLFGELIVGGIKIKDGLFIGDTYAAQDIEFIFNNKITHIINCSSNEVPNYFEAQGIEYLAIPWEETDTQILFDQRGQTIEIICQFIEKARRVGESVLVHSVKGQSRASCAICAYFMKKFRWGFYKTLEFLDSRRPDLEIRRNFFEQLKILADGINTLGEVSNNWDVMISNDPDIKREELIIRNTFFNSKIESTGPNIYAQRKKSKGKKKKRKRKIRWVDKVTKRKTATTCVLPHTDKPLKLIHRRNSSASYSILKVSPKQSFSKKRKNLSDQILDNKKIMRTEPDNRRRLAQNNNNGITSASRKKRPNSTHKRRDDSNKPLSKAKRLLNDHKKKRKKMYQSNSSKRLDSAGSGSNSVKRGNTPRRKKDGSADSRKKIGNSFNRKKKDKKESNNEKKNLGNFNKPPLAKKKNLNTALEKYKNEIGKKQQRNSSKKRKNKSNKEGLVTEDTTKGNSLSKNSSTNIPDDSKDIKKKTKVRPESAKLSKLSSLQPRYKLDENVNNINSAKAHQKTPLNSNNRLMQMISNPKEAKTFNGTLGENFLNISTNERKKFQQKVARGRYNIEAFRANLIEKNAKAGVLLKNDSKGAVRAHKIKAKGSLFDFSKYSNFLKQGKSSGQGDNKAKLKKDNSKGSKNKRPNSAPIKDAKKLKELESKRNGKMIKNIIPGYNKKIGKFGKKFAKNKFFRSKNEPGHDPNSIYTGPVIKKKMLN